MVKLLQVIAGARHGGAETFFTRLAIGLEQAGQEQLVVMRKDTHRSKTLRNAAIKPIELSFGGRFDFFTSTRLQRAINSYKPEIVLSWMNRATSKVRLGPFVHVARLGGYYNLKYYKNCDHLIGNTPKIVDYVVEKGWPIGKVHCLPNFVDDSKGVSVSRSAFDTPEGVPLLIALGRLHTNKAFDVLIRSMVELKETFLWLAGDGKEEAALKTLAKDLGVSERIKFLGWRMDTKDLIASADVLICPSRHEPLGNVVIEAWAQGKPVIAAASDGPRHLIEHGTNGMLTTIDDPTSLTSVIKEVFGDPKQFQALADAGNSTFQSYFTEKIVISEYQDLFNKVVS